MCCTTHDERDRHDDARNVPYLMATSDRTRCQCKYGEPCRRFADQEDLLCEWCRGIGDYLGHENACMELANRGYRGFARAISRSRTGLIRDGAIYEQLRRNPPKFETQWRGQSFTVEWKDEVNWRDEV